MSEWDIPTHQIRRNPPTVGDVAQEDHGSNVRDQPGGAAGGERAPEGDKRPEERSNAEELFAFGRFDEQPRQEQRQSNADSGLQARDVEVDGGRADGAGAGASEASLKQFSKLTKDLANAKRNFTMMIGRLFSNLQNVHMVSDPELLELRQSLNDTYKPLRQVYQETCKATGGVAVIAKVESGLGAWYQGRSEGGDWEEVVVGGEGLDAGGAAGGQVLV